MDTLITTAISYTNGNPHIGHLYEIIIADFIKKVFQLKQEIKEYGNIKLLTGTDEHGKKIEDTAKENNINPKQFCDINSKKFKDLYDRINIDYNYFIRTTDKEHIELVQKSINLSKLNDDIYKSFYEGWYCVREERFLTETEAKESNYMDPVNNKPYEKIKEESYYFKLEKYKNYISEIISNLVIPENQFLGFLDRLNELKDLSISRTSFKWGIEFPFDKDHITYVWFDALLNYITGAKLLNSNNIYHIIGKDILWFHSVIYPAIIKSCGYDDFIPKKILVHGFVLDKNKQKMSKSIGNVIDVGYLLDKFDENSVRYYFLKNTKLGDDFIFNEDNLVNDFNNILVKDFGNLLQRIYKLCQNNEEYLNSFFDKNSELIKSEIIEYEKLLDDFTVNFDIPHYFDHISLKLKLCNKIIQEQEPWKKEFNEKITILGSVLIKLKLIIKLLGPIIPKKITEIQNYFNWTNNYIKISNEKLKVFDIIRI